MFLNRKSKAQNHSLASQYINYEINLMLFSNHYFLSNVMTIRSESNEI